MIYKERSKLNMSNVICCGLAMMEPMPCGEFKWSDMELDKIMDTEDDSDHGYLVEVNIDYPSHLHDLHNDLPFLPVN